MEAIGLAKNLIDRFHNIILLPAPELQGDSLGSTLALLYTLRKLGKNVNARLEKIPERFSFLSGQIIPAARNFVIALNIEGKEISQMRYEKNIKDLRIYLALDKGQLKNEDVSLTPLSGDNSKEPVDSSTALISLGSQSIENIPRLFWELPIINIDNQPQNENFGEVNLVDMTSSLAEITTNLITSWQDPNLIDKEAATCLLTGIIWSSQNFRDPKTRPKTFQTSAFLIEKGANHQEIIQHLYKQKSISQIKLMGRVLEGLTFHESKEIYTSHIKECDFKDCQANSRDLAFVLEELKFHFRHLPSLLILWESHASPPLCKGVFISPNSGLTEKVLGHFEGVAKGRGVLFLIREADLKVAEEKILNIL